MTVYYKDIPVGMTFFRGGTTDYPLLNDLPRINGVELIGNKTGTDLGLLEKELDPTVPTHVKEITIQDIITWNNKAEHSDIPSVDQFITNSVNDLVNYYLKSEVYTKEEVSALIDVIQHLHFEKVDELPVEDIDPLAIYLVPTIDGSGNNYFEEYVYINDAFELLGTSKIDLTGYVTIDNLNDVLKNYALVDNVYTKKEVDDMFVGDATNLLISSPVTTEERVYDAGYSGEVLHELKDSADAYYCPNIVVGKKYVVKYKVNGLNYTRESVAIDINLINPEIPTGFAFLLGANIVGGQFYPDFHFDNGDFVVQGIYSDNYSVVTVSGYYDRNGYTIPSVELVSIEDSELRTKYFTKAETKTYVQDYAYSKQEVDDLFKSEGDNLIKNVAVFDYEVNSLIDSDGNSYCPEIEIGKQYLVKYVVNNVEYEKIVEARDYSIVDAGQPGRFLIGMTVVVGQPVFDLTFEQDTGAFVLWGSREDNEAWVNITMFDGSPVSSVTLVSVSDAKGVNKYFTTTETKAYVQEQIALAVTDVLNRAV